MKNTDLILIGTSAMNRSGASSSSSKKTSTVAAANSSCTSKSTTEVFEKMMREKMEYTRNNGIVDERDRPVSVIEYSWWNHEMTCTFIASMKLERFWWFWGDQKPDVGEVACWNKNNVKNDLQNNARNDVQKMKSSNRNNNDPPPLRARL